MVVCGVAARGGGEFGFLWSKSVLGAEVKRAIGGHWRGFWIGAVASFLFSEGAAVDTDFGEEKVRCCAD